MGRDSRQCGSYENDLVYNEYTVYEAGMCWGEGAWLGRRDGWIKIGVGGVGYEIMQITECLELLMSLHNSFV